MPAVSIIMATYNRAHFISETLNSIKEQKFTDWECIIIDDGSKDNTAEVLQHYLEADDRFRYTKRPDRFLKGLPGCRNAGLEMSKGDYVVFFDDDDIVHPENLQVCVEVLQRNSFSFCRYLRHVFTGDFRGDFEAGSPHQIDELGLNDLDKIVTGQIPLNSCQVMWKKECFKNNRFNETLMYAEEWECYTRILSTGIRGASIDKVLFYGRKHPESNTGEFWNNDPVRRSSKIRAAKLVIRNLREKRLLNFTLVRYFIQLGVFLKEKSIVTFVLEEGEIGTLQRMRFELIYHLYPVLVIGHRTKKYLKTFSK